MAIFDPLIAERTLHRGSQHGIGARGVVSWPWFGFTFGLAILMALLLIGPRVTPADQKATCVGNVYLPGPFGFGLNCDSPQFLWLAREPDGLLEQGNERQSRPGLIVAAAVLQDLISVVVKPGGEPKRIGTGFLDPKLISQSVARDLPAYIAYILLNIGLLLACFHFWRKLIEPQTRQCAAVGTIIVATGLLLVTNDVVKAFVWSAHTQMFNILIPLIALYATMRAWSGAVLERQFMLAIGIVAGLGATAYQAFVIFPACLVPICFLSTKRPIALTNLALLLLLCVAPSAMWYVYVLWHTGNYYQYEVAQGEVLWMVEAWSKGLANFLAEWINIFAAFVMMAIPQALPLLALMCWIAIAIVFDHRARAELPSLMPLALGAMYVSTTVLCFYTCVGWTVERLAYPVIPPLLAAAAGAAVIVASRMDLHRRIAFAAGCVVILTAQAGYLVSKDGPWS